MTEKRGRGRPKGSPNKRTVITSAHRKTAATRLTEALRKKEEWAVDLVIKLSDPKPKPMTAISPIPGWTSTSTLQDKINLINEQIEKGSLSYEESMLLLDIVKREHEVQEAHEWRKEFEQMKEAIEELLKERNKK